MDKEPFIIKSGKGHSVEIEQGSTHARTKRNVIAPQEEAQENRVVSEGAVEERKEFVLETQAVDAAAPVQEAQAVAEEALLAAATKQAEAEGQTRDLREHRETVDEAQAPSAAEDGPVLRNEARADEDARAEKAEAEKDRYAHAQEEVTADRDVRVEKAGVEADRFVSGDEEAVSDEQLVCEPEAPALTNRQKIEQLQATANRIQIEQGQRPPAELEIEEQPQHEPQMQVQAHPDSAMTKAVEDEEVAPVAPVVVVPDAPALPPELEGNLAFAPPTQDSAQSAFLARVKALRNNMSVTDDRLSKLQSKPPVQP
jgi:hypothetical protein